MDSIAYKTKFNNAMPVLLTVVIAALVSLFILNFGVTLNQVFAVVFTAMVLTVWFYNKTAGLVAAVIFFMIKPFWLRLAYAVDNSYNHSSGFDLLSITPALILVAMIVFHLYQMIVQNEKLCPDRTRKLLMLFVSLCFVSIFFPSNSIMVGLGGFQRNILPNMLVLYLAASLFKSEKNIQMLLKALLAVGLLSIFYGIGQYIRGIYPWEVQWFQEVGFAKSTAGWLTIGLRGIEFRIFSIFYYRTDFFFTNVLIFTLLFAYGKSFTGFLKSAKIIYYLSFFGLMIITFERTPFIMCCLSMAVIYFMHANKTRKKFLLTAATVIGISAYMTLLVFEPYLKSSGVETLIRLSEMTSPLEATSIHDRADNYWGPSLEVIKGNPIGVGIGQGSNTKASSQLKYADSGNIRTHNELLQKMMEVGIVGGILFLLLVISVLKASLKLARIKSPYQTFGVAMTACTIVFMMSSMITLTFSGGRGLTFWMLTGIVLGLLNMKNEEIKEPTVNGLTNVENRA